MVRMKDLFRSVDTKKAFFAMAILIIILISALVYINILKNPIPFTSAELIEQSKTNNDAGILTVHIDQFNINFSMVNTTLAIDYLLWGDYMPGYHISNILLHVLAALLVGLFALKITDRHTAFFAALIFAVHPVHTASVTDLIGRGEILAVIFSLLAIILFIQKERRWYHHACAWLAFFFALHSSHSANALPFLIALYVLFCAGRAELIKTLPFFLILALHLGLEAFATTNQYHRLAELPLSVHYLTELKMLGIYLKILLIPTDLSAYYYFPPVESFFNLYVIGALIALILMFTASYEAYQSSKAVSFLLLFIPIALLPALHLTPQRGMLSESFAYLPSVALCILLGIAFKHTVEQRSRITTIVLFSSFILIAGIATIDRNTVWTSNYSLLANALKTSPKSAPLHYNLGLEFEKRGQLIQALNEYEKVVRIDPQPMAYFHIARLYTTLGDTETGIRALKWAVALGFNNQDMLANNPDLEQLRQEPDYPSLLQRMASGERH